MLQDLNPSTYSSRHFHVLGMRKPDFQCNANREVATTSLLLQWTAPIARSFCEGCTWHHLQILVEAPLCWVWKRRAASAQSFTLSHQATVKIPRRDHLISVCSCHTGVVLHAHPVGGELHIYHIANWEVATLAARLG